MPDIAGIEKVRTMKTTHSRSVPANRNGSYIEMYMLRNERERLEKEGMRLDTRRELIVGRLQEIEEEMERLRKQEKKTRKKRKFDPEMAWVKTRKEANPEEPRKSNIEKESKKTKVKTGWKIKTLNTKRREF